MAKFATNVSGAMLLPSLIQVTESISGSVVPLAMFFSLIQFVPVQRKSHLVRIVLVQVVAAHLNSKLGSGHAAMAEVGGKRFA